MCNTGARPDCALESGCHKIDEQLLEQLRHHFNATRIRLFLAILLSVFAALLSYVMLNLLVGASLPKAMLLFRKTPIPFMIVYQVFVLAVVYLAPSYRKYRQYEKQFELPIRKYEAARTMVEGCNGKLHPEQAAKAMHSLLSAEEVLGHLESYRNLRREIEKNLEN